MKTRTFNWYLNGNESHVNIYFVDGTSFCRTVSHQDAMKLCKQGEAAIPYLMAKYSETDVFDVCFDDDNDSNSKGINGTYDECMNYIRRYNGTNESYFADYKGGVVSIYNVTKEEVVYTEEIR